MATFNFAKTGYAVDFSSSVDLLFDYDFSSHTSTTLKLFDDSKNYSAFGGKGLKYVIKSGEVVDVTAGTVTKFDLVIDGTKVVTITGLDVSAADLYDAAASNNDAMFLKLLLAGDDTINGTGRADKISGGKGDDVIRGKNGADKLDGGKGADDLYGGNGADRFVFKHVGDSTVSKAGRDIIFDFDRKEGDKINLEDIDANKNAAHDQDFHFIGKTAFHGQAGELRYKEGKSDTYIYGDVDGDAEPDFTIHLDDAFTVTDKYFVL